MAIRGGGLDRKSKASSEIPSSSLADIAFLLLIFFMVSTVFRTDKDRPIEWAEAAATEKIDEKVKNILNIWVERDGSIWINDHSMPWRMYPTLCARFTPSRIVIWSSRFEVIVRRPTSSWTLFRKSWCPLE